MQWMPVQFHHLFSGYRAPQAQRKQKKLMGFELSTKGTPGERGPVECMAMSEEALPESISPVSGNDAGWKFLRGVSGCV